jgi:hypothetical protein
MADDSLRGLSPEQIRRAEQLRDAMSDTASSVERFNKKLADSELGTSNVKTYFSDISASASKVASLQEEIKTSSKGTEKALNEQVKNLGKVRILNEKINELYTRASKTNGTTRSLLLDQARALEAGRDNAQELASIFQDLVNSSQDINKQSNFFDKLSDVVKDIPVLRKLSAPFQDAAKAAREAAIQNLKIKDTNSRINELTTHALKTGKGLTKEKLKELGLTEAVGNKTGPAAAKMLRDYQASNKAVNVMGVGFKTVGKSLMKALGPLAWIQLAVDAFKFLVSLVKTANEQTIGIARNLSITKEAAREVRDYFIGIAQSSKETYNTTGNLIKAQSELTEELGRAGIASESSLKSQTFLTERLKLSAGEAAKIVSRSEAFGENAENTLETILQENKERVKTGKSFLTQKQLLTAISKVNGQIAASFSFSNRAIAEGIAKVSRFGLNLQQARQISEGLLDFENSISAELEAELLTGRQLNLERARMKALTGDIADATEDVMSQMKGLTAQQRKSPLIMKSLAATIGLSVDELQDAYMLETDRTRQAKELERIYREQGATEAENYRKKMGLEQALMKDVKETVTLEEQYKEAVSKVKDLFAGLASDGTVEILADSIRALAEWISKLPGMQGSTVKVLQEAKASLGSSTQFEQFYNNNQTAAVSALEEVIDKRRRLGDINEETIAKLSSLYGQQAIEKALTGLETRLSKSKNVVDVAASKKYSGLKESTLNVEDFTIKTYPKDTLVMAGGTQLGESKETNTLLKELISAVKEGRIINLDGRRVNEGLSLATSKFDRR